MCRSGRSGWILAGAFCLAACGGGGGRDVGAGTEVFPPATPLSDEQATEAASGAALSLVAALSALVLDVPGLPAASTAADGNHGRSALSVRRWASLARQGGRSSRCAGGGTVQATCGEDGSGSTLLTRADECGTFDDAHGFYVITNGELRIHIQARGICRTGQVPADASRTLRYRHFRATIRDGPSVLETFAAPVLTQRIEPSGAGCAGVGRMTFDGRAVVTRADGVDVTLDTDGFILQLSDPGAPTCVQQVEATGRLDVFDHSSGRQLDAALHGLRMAFALESNPVAASIDGAATLDCVGEVAYASDAPLAGSGACASSGALRLTLPSGVTARSRARAGGVVEFDYDGDGQVDRTVGSCLDPTVAACR
jgi:hypothetical protein